MISDAVDFVRQLMMFTGLNQAQMARRQRQIIRHAHRADHWNADFGKRLAQHAFMDFAANAVEDDAAQGDIGVMHLDTVGDGGGGLRLSFDVEYQNDGQFQDAGEGRC